MNSLRAWLAACVCGLPLLAGCGESPAPADSAAPRAAEPVAVNVISVRSQVHAQTLIRSGTLRARRSVRLHSQEEGRIDHLPVYEGDRVETGAVLVRLDDRLLRAELNKAEANRQQAAQDHARLQRLVARKLVSEDEILRAATGLRVAEAEESLLKTRLGYLTVSAPFAGVITERGVEPGDVVPRFAHLLTLEDPQSLITEVPVSELILPALQTGDTVQVRIDALGDAQHTGRIARIHPSIDAATRQGLIEIALTPVPAGARAGQLCRVELPGVTAARRAVPLIALRQDPEGEYVYRVDAEGLARRTPVRTGVALGEYIEILDGLSDGDQVITRGFINLAADRPVRIVAAPASP
ncbi:MAG: efflux RND transporter periplasmic adaptor subunit [Gammaproteobacteria bacterium]